MKTKELAGIKEILPPLSSSDRKRLLNDIKKNGIQNPIIVSNDGFLLDGHHRLEIAKELGIVKDDIPVHTVDVSGDNAFMLAINLNLARRHLTLEQKREIIQGLRKRGYTQEEAGKTIGVSHQTVGRAQGSKNASNVQMDNTCITTPDLRYKIKKDNQEEIWERTKENITQSQIASDYGISQQRVGQIVDKVDKIKSREKELEAQKDEINDGIMPPDGLFDVIVIDPPWPYNNKNYDPDEWLGRVVLPYPDMSIEELEKINVPCKEDCIIWLWTTNAFMDEAYHLLKKWNFKPKTILTWDKQIMGTGKWLRGITEHCILGVKGHPKINLTNQTTLISEKRREHSRKPDIFYKLVDELCVGYKLDYFSREKREGWYQYGIEIDKFGEV